MIGISDFLGSNPYNDVPFVKVEDIVGKNIVIKGVTPFENEKNGKGVHVLIECDGDELRICTHATVLTSVLSKQALIEALDAGETIATKIIQRKSKNGRDMLAFEVPE